MTFARGTRFTPVLAKVSLSVQRGEFVTLLGPSGSGKTTLLNIMAGFERPTEGRVLAAGEPVTAPDPRRIFVFQERGVFPWLTVEGNVGFGLAQGRAKLPRREREERVAHYIDLVGLRGWEKAYPAQLSGGMKQRVEVARALAVKPDVLFLDEPFGALDSITRLTMRRELLRIWEAERPTVLFVTHDIDEALQLADRVVVLGGKPATVQQVVPIEIAHPRSLSGTRLLELRDSIFEALGVAHRV